MNYKEELFFLFHLFIQLFVLTWTHGHLVYSRSIIHSYHYIFCCSTCPRLSHWVILGVGSCSGLTPSCLHHFLTFWHHKMFLANLVHFLGQPGCRLFLQGALFLELENVIRNQDLGTRWVHLLGCISSAPPIHHCSSLVTIFHFRFPHILCVEKRKRVSISFTEAMSYLHPLEDSSVLLTTSLPLFSPFLALHIKTCVWHLHRRCLTTAVPTWSWIIMRVNYNLICM